MSGAASRSELEQVRQAAVDVVDVETGDLHRFRQQRAYRGHFSARALLWSLSYSMPDAEGMPATGRRKKEVAFLNGRRKPLRGRSDPVPVKSHSA